MCVSFFLCTPTQKKLYEKPKNTYWNAVTQKSYEKQNKNAIKSRLNNKKHPNDGIPRFGGERGLFVSFIWVQICNSLLWSLERSKLTLVIELLIFFRQRASSSLDSRAHCTQVAGGCKYLHETGRCTFKPQLSRQSFSHGNVLYLRLFSRGKQWYNIYRVVRKCMKQTFHTACRSALWLAWGSLLRCLPEYAGRLHTCWLGWEE